ncbi:MAG: hypothetical protein IPI73_14420 [Betaproteobacteria bacterium]|nr:hypothetical protein [Betaproteobacteria bacterium]
MDADGASSRVRRRSQIDNGALTPPTHRRTSAHAPAHRVPLSRADRVLRPRPRPHQQGPRRAIPRMGAPQTIWAIEDDGRDRGKLGRDPLEYRLAQANRPAMPPPLGWRITSCGLAECLTEAARRIGWEESARTPGPTAAWVSRR